MSKHAMALWAAATAAIAAQGQAQTASGEPPLTRENGYWVQTVTGEFPLGAVAVLRVSSRGPVALRGTTLGYNNDRLRYSLRKRVRASSQAEAARLMTLINASLQRQGPAAVVRVELPSTSFPAPELRLSGPRNLRHVWVSTASGSLDLRELDGDVDAGTAGGTIEADNIGGSLLARTGGGAIQVGAVGGNLRCVTAGGPISVKRAGGEAWLETGGGEVFLDEAGGPVHASSGAGNVEIGRSASSVAARTSGGMVKVGEAGGRVDVESSGGGIQVSAARGVRCESVGGGIKLIGVSGELRIATAIGSILAEVLRGIENSSLSTGSGDITVLIPSNLAVTVQAQNDSPGRYGRIISEFPEVRVQTAAAQAAGRVIAAGAINGGGPLLTIAAADGTIFLRRQK